MSSLSHLVTTKYHKYNQLTIDELAGQALFKTLIDYKRNVCEEVRLVYSCAVNSHLHLPILVAELLSHN